ncbi:MAG: NAD(P)H-dependent oxidoreductase [Candidatus Nomurabacteria bacterium]|nr:NAD(P)H-dependent oxidoreductase [Candidatus Nomurabacteria bacterium]USN87960.1 MAG: NAD(P)H-dependent oxidoreductase [Candidatus Nomurabacteria bacterium]
MKNPKNILVLCGHPDKESYSGQMTDNYQLAAEEAGHNVQRVNLGDLSFDPILHKGYKEIQELEPDLVDLQEKFLWAEHIVIVYPNWWCTMPALLKGLFDRFWLPGFAFNFNKETKQVEKHLKGRTGRVIILSGSHSPFKTWWQYGDYTNEIQYGIMEFAGIRTAVSAFGPCEKVDDKTRKKWEKEVVELGQKGV